MTQEVAIALIHGDTEYADLLRTEGFVRVEKDVVFEFDSMAMEYFERMLRDAL